MKDMLMPLIMLLSLIASTAIAVLVYRFTRRQARMEALNSSIRAGMRSRPLRGTADLSIKRVASGVRSSLHHRFRVAIPFRTVE
jgi:hypothetical protein